MVGNCPGTLQAIRSASLPCLPTMAILADSSLPFQILMASIGVGARLLKRGALRKEALRVLLEEEDIWRKGLVKGECGGEGMLFDDGSKDDGSSL